MNDRDMTAYVTRGELREELTRALEIWGGALHSRIEEGERRLEQRIDQRFEQMSIDLARHTNAILESFRIQISAIDDKYKDLPGRMKHVEDAVFPAEPPRRARRRSS